MLRLIRAYAAAAVTLGSASSTSKAQSSPASPPPPVEMRRTLAVNGDQRSFLLYVPSGYRRGQPAPLVLVFHGGGGRGSGIAPHTGFSRLAEGEGFL